MKDSRDRGAIAVEFALVLPLVLACIFFLLATGFRAVNVAFADHQATVAVRTASIRTGQNPSSPYPSEAEICAGVASLPLAGPINSCALINEPNNDQPNLWGVGDRVTVNLVYDLGTFDNIFGPVKGSASVMRE